MVLSACSNYFRDLFKSNPCQHPIVILKDMKIEDLKAIVDFMYKGEVNVSQNQLGALLKTAEVLKVKGLTEVSDDSDKSAEKRGISHVDEPGVHPTSSGAAQPASAATAGRKKKRRKTKKVNGGSSGDEASGSESGPSSEDEESVDVSAVKRVKESNQSSATQQHSQPHPQSIPEQMPSVMQTRRRALQMQMPQLQQAINQVQNASQQRENVENSSDGHLDDSSEAWMQERPLPLPAHATDPEEESDEMIDVKPIISFDEGSTGSVGVPATPNSSAVTSEMDVMAQSTPVSTPATSITLAQTLAKIDLGLLPRGFGRCPICNKSLFHLKRHMNEVHLGVVYKCHLCGRRFKRTDKLNTHMSHAHSM
ncbi:zinc finger protein-like protein [Dinothrombium tinctorium]|uniref:Zinc finger protein-like protein n=1 Tax=Dinothrombium tinctorium TaxID=1965070 RepID=A0A3S3RPE3_9ACAR|nr:zinc finger protein-like protein [Dinothrombium tinctorium]